MHKNAAIIVLYGASCAGKTSILDDLMAAHPTWHGEGMDRIAGKPAFQSTATYFEGLIAQEADTQETLQELRHYRLVDIVAAMLYEHQDFEALQDEAAFQCLAHRFAPQVQAYRFPPTAQRMLEIFTRSLHHSREGEISLLDLVPAQGKDVIDLLKAFLANEQHICPLAIFLIDCPVPVLCERILARNQEAKSRQAWDQWRELSVALEQHADIAQRSIADYTAVYDSSCLTAQAIARKIRAIIEKIE